MTINEEPPSGQKDTDAKDMVIRSVNSMRSVTSVETTDDNRVEKRKKEAELKIRMKIIERKNEEEKTEEELRLYASFEQRRKRKNERSRERTKENKIEMDRIMAIPEHERTANDKRWLATHLTAKKRKNLKDRERRKRIRQGGNSSSSTRHSLSPTGYNEDLSLSNTFTSQESFADLEPVDSMDATADGDGPAIIPGEAICPKLYLHLASVIESPVSPFFTKDEARPYSNSHSNHDQNNNSSSSSRTANFRGEGLASTTSPKQSSPIRIPFRESSSRSSIFRRK